MYVVFTCIGTGIEVVMTAFLHWVTLAPEPPKSGSGLINETMQICVVELACMEYG